MDAKMIITITATETIMGIVNNVPISFFLPFFISPLSLIPDSWINQCINNIYNQI